MGGERLGIYSTEWHSVVWLQADGDSTRKSWVGQRWAA